MATDTDQTVKAKKPARPKMLQRIVEAIQAQPPTNKGVSITTIKNFMIEKYGMENNETLKNSLRKGIAEGALEDLVVRPKGSEATGLTGRLKINKLKLASMEKEKNKKMKLDAKRAEVKEKAFKAKTDKPKSRADKPRSKKVKENKSPKKTKTTPKTTPKKTASKKPTEAKPKAAGKKTPTKKTPTKKAPAKKAAAGARVKKAAATAPSTPREKLKATKSKKARV
ncbi:histone H1-gamma, late-like [Lineus longissimus]|uniref:histone H1-gamma, late-like n=1 Tax=Lineus longissimus TaxID=88925 RepID=UPI002B4C2997